jgi:hypothetical protein
MLEIDEEGDSTYIEWGDPDSFLVEELYLKQKSQKASVYRW